MFDTAGEVEELVWQMRLADFPRGVNRAKINSLFNGQAPYTEEQARENNLAVNYNDLSAPRMAHDARRQFSSAFQKPANFFKVQIDSGPIHKRAARSTIITKELNKRLKKSLPYFETLRSTFANVVLHGIGPVVWQDSERWYPKAKGVEDILVPGRTTLDLDNMSLFAVLESYTPMQLRKLTQGPNRDPGWNMELVKKLIEQAEKEILGFGIPQSEIMSPEKQVERMHQDAGIFAADSLTTIDAWTFYFWDDSGKESGWNKRVILDANWALGAGGTTPSGRDLKSKADTRGEWLYNPGKRKYADKIGELIHFQFGDLSAVAPFHYHSVRSLGYLLYAVCHLQNRLRCKFMDSVFEQLMQYYRVKSLDDVERALKINLIDKGFVDETVQFIPPAERWQIDQALAEMALAQNDSIIGQNASIYRSETDYANKGKEKTATEVMAEVNAATALVGAALGQAYQYQEFQYHEIARRFTVKNSKDADVREFRNACLKQGVPEEILNDVNQWEVTSERVMGGGNKTQEMALAQQLMQWRPMFDPEPQREVLYSAVLAFTDDAAMAQRLVPDNPNKVSNSKHDAQLTAGALMQGLHVDLQTGQNHIEIVEALLHEMALVIQGIEQAGSMATQLQISGLQNMAQYVGQQIAVIAQNPEEKSRVKGYSDDLGKLMNLVKAYAQRLAEQQKQAQQGQQQDPENIVKLQGMQMQNEAKAANTRESHSQRTSQRQTQFELEMEREAQRHQLALEKQASESALQLGVKAQEVSLQKQKNELKSKKTNAAND